MGDREEERLWLRRFTDAVALDRLGVGWPPRTQEEQTEAFRARSKTYLKLLMTLDEKQLVLLQEYAETLRKEQDFWSRRSFYLGYQAAEDPCAQNGRTAAK